MTGRRARIIFVFVHRGGRRPHDGGMQRPWNRFWRRPRTRICLAVVGVYAFAAISGQVTVWWARARDVTPAYQRADLTRAHEPPGTPGHPLGTDGLGRDVLLRLVQGARIALAVGLGTSLIAMPLGVTLGLLAGYFGGRVDDMVVWLYTTISSVPSLLLILALVMLMGGGLTAVCIGIGLTTWVGVCRWVRAETLRHRESEHVAAARALGAGPIRILGRHILPNLLPVLVITFTLRFPATVGTEVFLSFLGVGVSGEPSWGTMIAQGRLRLWQGAWWELTFASVAVFGLVLALNLLGEALRDALDPRSG